MKRALALFYVAGLFLLGTLIGGLGMRLYHDIHAPRPPMSGHGPMAGHGRRIAEGELVRFLELTHEQKLQVEQILAESREEADALRRELEPRLRDHMAQTHERIVEILDPGQRERLEEFKLQHHGHAERFFLGHP